MSEITQTETIALVTEFNYENRAELRRNSYSLCLVAMMIMIAALALVLSVL